MARPPFDAEKALQQAKRKRSRAVTEGAGVPKGKLHDLEPLPLDDMDMQAMDLQNAGVSVGRKDDRLRD